MFNDDTDIDEVSGDYESGPFCPHWSDPADCSTCHEKCARCGHLWLDHEQIRDADGEPEAVKCFDCDSCPAFEFPPRPAGGG